MSGRSTPKRIDRRRSIVTLVSQQGYASIEQLARYFSVTPQTIRRDIDALAKAGELQRYHGGAGLAQSERRELSRDEQAKRRIARLVASHISDSTSLFISTGSTAATVAKALKSHHHLRIVTNSLGVAQQLSDIASFEVTIVGGQVRSSDGCSVGDAALELIRRFKVDVGIIGVSAVDEDGSLLDCTYQGARISEAIIENSRRTYLVADQGKFGRKAMARLGSLSQVDTWFTDQRPPTALAELLESFQVRVVFPNLSQASDARAGLTGAQAR